jgi:hypothetical protein
MFMYIVLDSPFVREAGSNHLALYSNPVIESCFVDEIYAQFHAGGCMNLDSEMVFSAECMNLIDWMSSRVIDSIVHIFAKICRPQEGNKVCIEVEVEIPLCFEIES